MKNLEQKYLDFISTVSHELRTPLTSIRGFADTLLGSYDMLSEEQKKKSLNIIKEQSNRLINLVENLLDVAEMQTKDEKFVFKAQNAKKIIDDVIFLVKNQYKNYKYTVIESKNVSKILVDTDKFQQIMFNLIENAAKYSPENTEITIKIEDCINDMVSVKVIDEGCGIDIKNREKIFNKFVRLDNFLTNKAQGSGLGLYITKNLVEKMHGTIQVLDSQKGSVFEVKFPIAKIDEPVHQKMVEDK